jgi:hypothetical protein
MLPEEFLCRFRNLFRVLNEFLMPPMNTEDMSAIELRFDARLSVEDLVGRIADLVLQRQSMRAEGVDSALLEHNRLELVRAHQDLSYALIERHCPPKPAEAAA